MPTALQLEKLKWIVITSENAEEVFRKLEEKGIGTLKKGFDTSKNSPPLRKIPHIKN